MYINQGQETLPNGLVSIMMYAEKICFLLAVFTLHNKIQFLFKNWMGGGCVI
jgi:hypothetical protein